MKLLSRYMCSLVEIINVWEEQSAFDESGKVIFEIHIIRGLYRPLLMNLKSFIYLHCPIK